MIFISIISCNSDESVKKPPPPKSPTANSYDSNLINCLSGTLDTLWVDRDKFLSLTNDKIIFSFLIGKTNNLLLSGWDPKGWPFKHKYDSIPVLTLSQGKADRLMIIGSGTYLGNIVLKDIGKIQTKLKNAPSQLFVIFAPSITSGNITYKILFGTELQSFAKKSFAVIESDYDANPTPPHEY